VDGVSNLVFIEDKQHGNREEISKDAEARMYPTYVFALKGWCRKEGKIVQKT